MHRRFFRKPLGIIAALLSLCAAGTAMAGEPSGGATMQNDVRVLTEAVEKRGGVLSCQTRNFDDYRAVCCAHSRGGKLYYKLYNRKQCRDLRGTEVARSRCPARQRSSDPQKALVCCRTRESSFKGVYGKTVFDWKMMPAGRCKQAPAGLVVDNRNCVRHKTARDRMLACKKRGSGWEWKNNRCQRESVRDKRKICCEFNDGPALGPRGPRKVLKRHEFMTADACRKKKHLQPKIVAHSQCRR